MNHALLATALIASSVLGISLAAAQPPRAAAAATPTASAPPDRLKITVDTMEPKVVRPHDTVVITGTLMNVSSITLTAVSVGVTASSHRIDTRYDLAHDSDPATIVGTLVSDTRQFLGPLRPGQSVAWEISIPVQRLELPSSAADFGAYPLTIEGRSTDGGPTLTTRLPTSLLWMPTGAQFNPTQVSWLLPLVDGIHRAAGDTFLDDNLARDLASTGRLGQLLAVARAAQLPITYIVDPALVDDATVMAASAPTPPSTPPAGGTPTGAGAQTRAPGTHATAPPSASSTATPAPKPSASAKPSSKPTASKSAAVASTPSSPYQVAGSGNGTAAGAGATAAASWLTSLREAVTTPGTSLVGLPYGDADIVALGRAGLGKEIAIARSTGQSVLAADLAAPTLPDVAWPLGGLLDESSLDDLASDFVGTVILTDQALPAQDATAVPGVRTDLQTASGNVHAVLTDSTLGSILANPASIGGGMRMAEQRFLAETMLVTEQRPGAGSSLVISPPRFWNTANGFAATVLADVGSVPWLHGVGLGAIAGQPNDGVPRNPLVYPAGARAAEIAQADLAPIAGVRSDLAAFSAILGPTTTETFVNTLSVAILRAESGELRRLPAKAAAIRDTVRTALDAQIGKVFISNPRLITLTSRKQKIPITIVNNLPDPVTVQIRLTALNLARLKVTPVAPITVPGKGGRREVLVAIEATTSGRFQVQAQLMTPDATARSYGRPVQFELNSTAYGAVALAIAGAAAGLLFLLSAVRLIRRVRRGKRAHLDDVVGPSQDAQYESVASDSAAATDSTPTS